MFGDSTVTYDQAAVDRAIEALRELGAGGQERWQPNNSTNSVTNEYLAHTVLRAAAGLP